MTKLSAVLIVKDESANIRDCLSSLSFADEIVVLDTGSSDDTVAIAREMGANVHSLPLWEGFGKAKQAAVKLASYDWILSIDADERITLKLQAELGELKQRDFDSKAWYIRRISYYLGKPVHYSGWQNDAPLRLFHRAHGGFNDLPVHEGIRTQMPKARCQNAMLHLTYPTQESHYKKMRFYGDLAQEKRHSALAAGARAVHKFLKMYILRLGFLDGFTGLLLAKNSAWGIWYKYKK